MSVFIDGVWGPLAQHNDVTNGGPECAAQSTFNFKVLCNFALVSSPFQMSHIVTIPFLYVEMGKPHFTK